MLLRASMPKSLEQLPRIFFNNCHCGYFKQKSEINSTVVLYKYERKEGKNLIEQIYNFRRNINGMKKCRKKVHNESKDFLRNDFLQNSRKSRENIPNT